MPNSKFNLQTVIQTKPVAQSFVALFGSSVNELSSKTIFGNYFWNARKHVKYSWNESQYIM